MSDTRYEWYRGDEPPAKEKEGKLIVVATNSTNGINEIPYFGFYEDGHYWLYIDRYNLRAVENSEEVKWWLPIREPGKEVKT